MKNKRKINNYSLASSNSSEKTTNSLPLTN